MGIEPTSEAWEASILPLYDARSVGLILSTITARKQPLRTTKEKTPSRGGAGQTLNSKSQKPRRGPEEVARPGPRRDAYFVTVTFTGTTMLKLPAPILTFIAKLPKGVPFRLAPLLLHPEAPLSSSTTASKKPPAYRSRGRTRFPRAN
jgi:hypothetical protein